jgi:hypothetical protein
LKVVGVFGVFRAPLHNQILNYLLRLVCIARIQQTIASAGSYCFNESVCHL